MESKIRQKSIMKQKFYLKWLKQLQNLNNNKAIVNNLIIGKKNQQYLKSEGLMANQLGFKILIYNAILIL